MSVTQTLFARWIQAKKFTSSRQGCLALGVKPQAATYWKEGRNAEAHVIEQMAADLGENASAWVLAAAAEKARDSDEKRALNRMAKQLGYAAVILLALAHYTNAKSEVIHNAASEQFYITQTDYTFTQIEGDVGGWHGVRVRLTVSMAR